MKRFLLILITLLIIASPVSANYFPDITVTSTDGIWTDTRAFTTINAAATAIGAVDKRTIVIPNEQVVTALTITSNITLKFERDGSIANSGQLIIQTPNIIADDHQIFTGAGDIDFASGSIVRSTWFSDIAEAIDVTSDDTLIMVISQTETTTASAAVGNNVTLRWNSPFILTVAGAHTLSNVRNIESGNYQILAGAGNVDFLDGIELKLSWFLNLRAVLTWVTTEEVTIIVDEDSVIDFTDTVDTNEKIKVLPGGILNISVAIVLTIDGPFDAGLYQVFDGAGAVDFSGGVLERLYPQWWSNCLPDGSTDCQAAYAAAITAAPDGGVIYITPGLWNFNTALVITDRVSLVGEGIASYLQFSLDTTTDCITFGTGEGDGFAVFGAVHWKDFVIGASDGDARSGLVLKSMSNSKFTGIHVPVFAHVGNAAIWIQWALESHFDFIMTSNLGYPYGDGAVTDEADMMRITSSANGTTIFNICELDVDFAGSTDQVGIRMIANEGSSMNSRVSGTIQSLEGAAIDLTGGRLTHFTNLHLEGTGVLDTNELIIRQSHGAYIGPNFYASTITGIDSIQLIDCIGVVIDGVEVNRITIDADCEHTKIGTVFFRSSFTNIGLYDDSPSTVLTTSNMEAYLKASQGGSFTDANSTVINGSAERWTATNAVPPGGWTDLGAAPTYTREVVIVKHETASVKVTNAGAAQTAAIALYPAGTLASMAASDRAAVTAWAYLDSGSGNTLDCILTWIGGGAGNKVIYTITDVDQWVKFSAVYQVRGPSENATVVQLQFVPSGAATTFYVDAVSNIVSNHGAPLYWAANANEFPFFTGTATWNPGNLIAGAQETKDFTVTGAAIGMVAYAGAGIDVTDIIVSATVTAANVVTVVLANETAGAIDLGSGTWNVAAEDVFP